MIKVKFVYFRILICFIGCFLLSGCAASEEYLTRDITEYRNFSGHISKEESDIFSGLKIFPQEISENMKETSYYYECGNFALDNNYLICLECNWKEENFQDEVERLNDLTVTYEGKTQDIIYTERGFHYPAYVSIYAEDMLSMEYALVDEETCRIIYLFSQLNSDIDEKIDVDYLKDKEDDFDSPLLSDGYNMYFFETGNGEGIYIK